jgi:N-acetylmuramoyl-L-alanine amidase
MQRFSRASVLQILSHVAYLLTSVVLLAACARTAPPMTTDSESGMLPPPPPVELPAAPSVAEQVSQTPAVSDGEVSGEAAGGADLAAPGGGFASPNASEAGPEASECQSRPAVPLSSLSPAERSAMFREPLPAAPLWNPPGQKRVGLQAGHWLVEQSPSELANLGHGSMGGGKLEWEVNLDLARRAAALLERTGVLVDVLPATVPPRYRAHAFVSIHADGDESGQLRGFKVARPGFSSIPTADDRLVATLNGAYERATGLPRDDAHISIRMRYYYAFNSRRYCHAVATGVPQAIVETGFLTSAIDRSLLLGNPDAAARGIADGILEFLELNEAG